MKILMIEDFFHPQAGYQLNVLCPYLVKFGHEVIIICGELDLFPDYLTNFFGKERIGEKDEEFTRNTGVQIIRLPVKKYISGRAIMNIPVKEVDKYKPDIVFVHGNDSYIGMLLIMKQKKLKYPLITDSHMLDMASKNKQALLYRWCYKHFITPIIKRHNTIVIRTVDDPFVMKWYGIPQQQSPVIGFGSDTLRFYPDNKNRLVMRKILGIKDDDIVIIYAGKLDETKGGLFLADAIKEKISIQNVNIKFLIVGNVSGKDSEEIINKFKHSQNDIIMEKTQPYAELPKWFQASDIAIFPKQCSLTYYDVLACGLPVLLEDNDIGKKRAKECKAAFTFCAGNISDFRFKLEKIINIVYTERNKASNELSETAIKYINEKYDYQNQARKYEAIMKNVINEFKGKGKMA